MLESRSYTVRGGNLGELVLHNEIQYNNFSYKQESTANNVKCSAYVKGTHHIMSKGQNIASHIMNIYPRKTALAFHII